jgi:3',5'-nucleoside bisphosphate phosphatase
MAEYVDLHCHSTASDGTLPPAEVARLAHRSGLVGFALTDHDTAEGLGEAAAESARLGLRFIPGIEISCTHPHPGIMHLLGYCVDPRSAHLAELSRQLVEARNNRNPRIIDRLRELGIAITMEEVEAQAGGSVVGRPHIAAILVRKGYVSSIKHAFDKYLAPGGLAWFDKERLTPRQAVDLVVQSGGIAALAHPVQLRTENDAQLERVVKDMMDLGVMGLEVIHSDHTPELVDRYTRLADRLGLLKTGGSDFHGNNKNDIAMGIARGQRIPRQYMDDLLARHAEQRR